MGKKQVWFVTGASKGLGLSLVKKLLSQGHQVAATSRDKAALERAVGSATPDFLPLQVDLSREDNLKGAVARTTALFGRIDVLVNNAGYGQGGSTEEVSDSEARANFEVNVFGLLNVTRAVLPVMRAQGSGHVFNIASIAGYSGAFSGWGIYCATKFAVAGLTESLARDVAPFGVKVTLVYPGYFRTNFLEGDSLRLPAAPISAYAEAAESIRVHQEQIRGSQPGDPEKAADVMIRMSGEARPPLHLFLGSDAVSIAKEKAQEVIRAIAAWEKISVSTDY